MIILKILIASIFLSSGPSDGWFTVEKKSQPTEQREDDPSIWALFSKKLGDERFQVRMPANPVYRYLEAGGFEISSTRDGETFLLRVDAEDFPDAVEGQWAQEYFVKSGSHFYHFKTLSENADPTHHEAFISSFLIEKIS